MGEEDETEDEGNNKKRPWENNCVEISDDENEVTTVAKPPPKRQRTTAPKATPKATAPKNQTTASKEGKKPKATEAQLHAKKIIKTKKAVGSTSVTKVTGKSLPTEGASTNGPVKNQREDKKQQTVQQKRYCCDLCKVKCNSEVMLASHLRGKKHIAQLEGSKKDGKPVMPASAGKKVKANQRAKREEPENTEFAEVAKLFD